MWFETLCILLFGAGLGSLVTYIFSVTRETGGTLRVDHSNPEKDAYLFEIDDLDNLDKKKRIVLNIDHNARLSQR